MEEIGFRRALHRPGTMVDAGAHEGRMTLPLEQPPTSWLRSIRCAVVRGLQRGAAAAWICETPSYVTMRPEALSDRSGSTMIAAPRVNGKLQDEWASPPGSRPLKHGWRLFSD
jgi:hypothetical protein